MATCPVCGAAFDERRFQLVLPGRAESFDRFECALRWAARAPGGLADGEGNASGAAVRARGDDPRTEPG